MNYGARYSKILLSQINKGMSVVFQKLFCIFRYTSEEISVTFQKQVKSTRVVPAGFPTEARMCTRSNAVSKP